MLHARQDFIQANSGGAVRRGNGRKVAGVFLSGIFIFMTGKSHESSKNASDIKTTRHER